MGLKDTLCWAGDQDGKIPYVDYLRIRRDDSIAVARQVLLTIDNSGYENLGYTDRQKQILAKAFSAVSPLLNSSLPSRYLLDTGCSRFLYIPLDTTPEGFRASLQIGEDDFAFRLSQPLGEEELGVDLMRSLVQPDYYPFFGEPDLLFAFWYCGRPATYFQNAETLFRNLAELGTSDPITAWWTKDQEELAAIVYPNSEEYRIPYLMRHLVLVDPQNPAQESMALVRKANVRIDHLPSPASLTNL